MEPDSPIETPASKRPTQTPTKVPGGSPLPAPDAGMVGSAVDSGDAVSAGATRESTIDEPRGIDGRVLLTLLGACLLLVSLAAKLLFTSPFHSSLAAMLGAIALGLPIVYDALRGLLRSRSSERLPSETGPGARPHSAVEELVALAVVASFASGQYLECGSIAFFLLLASFIESRSALGARKTIESLLRITPTRAHRIAEGSESEVDARELRTGDLIAIRPGDRVPADGQVESGTGTVNEAPITGESVPVEKEAGSEVFAGTINESGSLRVRVTRSGEDSALGQVQRLILQASASSPPVVRMLDRYAAYYTPVVLMLGGLVLFFTRDIDRAVSLLLIACPTAIILTGPTAMVAALSSAARLGLFIKDIGHLETARKVTALVLDKTGTLTTGQLNVTRLSPSEGVDAADLLATCATAEQESRHPVARSVLRAAHRARVKLRRAEHFEEAAGRGVSVVDEGHRVLVGRAAFIEEHGVPLDGLDNIEDGDADGLSLLWVARDGRAIGWIGLEDSTREDAREALEELADLGVGRRVLLTGDRWSPARRAAKNVPLTDVHAEALPGDKLELVESLKADGHKVAVVGDGVNDGPALAAGHISVAMGAAGSDVAIHSASIALMNNRLDRLPFLIRLSMATVRVVRQNLIGVLIYVVAMLVLLGLGLVPPILAAIANGLSAIAVVFNSARLVREGEELAPVENLADGGGRSDAVQREEGDR